MSQTSTISLRQVPLLRLLLPFLIGLLLGWWKPAVFVGPSAGLALLITAAPLLYFGWGRRSLSQNLYWGLALYLWLLAFGWWRASEHYQLQRSSHFSHARAILGESYSWKGKVETIRATEKSLRLRVSVHTFRDSTLSASHPTMGKLLLYLPKDDRSKTLLPGQQLVFTAEAERITPPLNPAAFDFASWQARQNVFHRARAAAADWELAGEDLSLRGHAYLIREHLLTILGKYLNPESDEYAVGAALILGKKDALSTDLRNAYAETGAVHVLAVSGLHLGFIAWGLGLIFGWGPFKRPSWRWIRLGCILAGIWAFALITGLSPSVQRAATMFSAVWIGVVLGRQSSIYNTLGASAFLLLFIDPYLLFDLGFQLSYLAVLGIVFFQPRIYRLWSTSWWVLDKGWALISVALAAQLTTFPLSLYYFHQFPIYFLLSGLVVVLAASIILGLGVLLFAVSWWPLLASLVGSILGGVLWLNNAFILQLQKLPGHLVEGVWIDGWQLVALLIAVLMIAVYVVQRRASWLIMALAAMLVVFGVNFWHQAKSRQQKRWIIYHQYRATVVDAISGHHRHTISSLDEGDPDLTWSVELYREKVQATRLVSTNGNWQVNPPIYKLYDQALVLIDRNWEAPDVPEQPLAVAIVLLKDAPNVRFSTLQKHFNATAWVCDGSNYPRSVKAWKEEAASLGLKLHVTAEDGAYILDF